MNIRRNGGSRLVMGAGTMLTIAATLALCPLAVQAQHAGGGGGHSGVGGGGSHCGGGGGGFHGGDGGALRGGGGGGRGGDGGFRGNGGFRGGGYQGGGYGGGGWDRGYYGAPAIIFGTPYDYCTPPLAYGRDDYYGYRRRRCD